MTESRSRASVSTRGPVLIIGTGLLGTSLALALRAADVEIQLSDTSPTYDGFDVFRHDEYHQLGVRAL